ncbi:MAG: hypothetical protein E7564_06175 [Ruminococcaceae bacterium]|nr:hypothetical protein [Oscillospiraceae bacterium]
MRSDLINIYRNFIHLSEAIALIDIREASASHKIKIKEEAQKNGSIFLNLRYSEAIETLKGTIYDLFIPKTAKDVTMILSKDEDSLEDALDNISAVADEEIIIEYRYIK